MKSIQIQIVGLEIIIICLFLKKINDYRARKKLLGKPFK